MANPKIWDGRDGSGISSFGILHFIEGVVYFDDRVLSEWLGENFFECYIELEVVKPDTHDAKGSSDKYPMDEKIRPLVQALNEKGFRTLSSCEGHMQDTKYGSQRIRYPYVTVYKASVPLGTLVMNYPGWTWSHVGCSPEDVNVARMQPMEEAKTQEELEKYQGDVLELAAKIRQL